MVFSKRTGEKLDPQRAAGDEAFNNCSMCQVSHASHAVTATLLSESITRSSGYTSGLVFHCFIVVSHFFIISSPQVALQVL